MERIKKALERAREERQTHEADPTGRGKDVERPARQIITAAKPVEIEYTKTRIVKTDPDLLLEKRVVASLDNNPIADAYKVLRTQVLHRMRANNWNSLAITSPTEGNGKSLTAVNLAVSLAREVNHTVLLVDLDLRKPTIRDYFLKETGYGISDYLNHDVPLSEILINPDVERLVVLPGNEAFPHSSEMLSSPKMVQLAEELKTRYPSRIVLIDMPPMLACDDVLAFAPYIDAVLLVVAEGETREDHLKRAVQLLEGTEICGIVLNKSREVGSSKAYDYGYGY